MVSERNGWQRFKDVMNIFGGVGRKPKKARKKGEGNGDPGPEPGWKGSTPFP